MRDAFYMFICIDALIFLAFIFNVYQFLSGNPDVGMEIIWRGAKVLICLLIATIACYFITRPKYLKFLKLKKRIARKNPSK